MGDDFPANVGTANVAKDPDVLRDAVGRQAELPTALDRRRLRRGLPREGPRDDPRRRGGSQRRPDPGRHRPCVPGGVQRLRRRLRAQTSPARWVPTPAKSVAAVYRDLVNPAGQAALHPRPAWSGLQRRSWRPSWPLSVAASTQGLTEMTRGRGDMLARRGCAATPRATTPTPPTPGCRSTASISAADHRSRQVEEDRRIREVAPFMSYGDFTGHAPMRTVLWLTTPALGFLVPAMAPVLVVFQHRRPCDAVPGPGSIWPRRLAELLDPTELSTPWCSRASVRRRLRRLPDRPGRPPRPVTRLTRDALRRSAAGCTDTQVIVDAFHAAGCVTMAAEARGRIRPGAAVIVLLLGAGRRPDGRTGLGTARRAAPVGDTTTRCCPVTVRSSSPTPICRSRSARRTNDADPTAASTIGRHQDPGLR